MIWEASECVEAIEPCENMEFNITSFEAEYNFDYTLVPGHGCWLEMTRTRNGSWGQLFINVTYEEDIGRLLVYDSAITAENVGEYTFDTEEQWSEYLTGMVYADSGWEDKKVFIANRDENAPAFFTYQYNSGLKTAAALGATASLLMM